MSIALGGGGGGGYLGGNCGTGVRARISKPTPFIYLVFEKMDPFIYLIVQNVDLFIYCPLIFYTHLLLVVDVYRSHIRTMPYIGSYLSGRNEGNYGFCTLLLEK